MNRTEQKFLKFIDEKELINIGDKILTAFSGGPDSVFLLFLLHKFQKRLGVEISAVHINHSLRGTAAAEDEKFCREFCSERNIEFTAVKKNVRSFAVKNGYSLEEAGRITRYREFEKFLRKKKLDKIATAHNAGDNTETVLLNVIKGTGLDGISGIPARRDNIIRPVLCCTKDEILAYLESNKIPYCIDKSNEGSDFDRNFLRNRVLPLIREKLNPSIDNALLISSENFGNIKDYILANEIKIFENIERDSSGNLLIPVADLRKADRTLKGMLLKNILSRELGIQVYSYDIKKVLSLESAQTGKKIELSGGILVFREREHLKFISGAASQDNFEAEIRVGQTKKIPGGKLIIKICDKGSLVYSNNKNKEYISADSVSNEFTIRRWKEGDSFHPLGLKGTKKISDFLNEQKVESSGKKDHLILLNRNKIVWVIGLRIDDRFKITSSTQKILELCLN